MYNVVMVANNKRNNIWLGRYTWFVLIFNLFVIVWGGFVSASGSGDGCGTSWPLCDEAADITNSSTFIELFHRGTAGLALISVIIMVIWAFRVAPKGEPIRKLAVWSLIFELGEAAIGAILVLYGFVATNESLFRAFLQPLHLVNNYLLVGALGLTAWYAGGRPRTDLLRNRPLMVALCGLLIVSTFGTIASLASTIFPSDTFFDGIQKDFASNAHYLIRLRIWQQIIIRIRLT